MQKITLLACTLFASIALAQGAPATTNKPTVPAAKNSVDAAKAKNDGAMATSVTTTTTTNTNANAMEMPKAAPEVEEMFKTRKGAWKCTGMAMTPSGQQVTMKATMTTKMELGKHWMVTNFSEKGKKDGLTFTAYTTYQPSNKMWTQLYVDNMGSHEVMTAAAPTGNVMKWDGETPMNGMMMKTRHHEEMISAKEVKHVGEMSMDGKTWQTGYEMICKK